MGLNAVLKDRARTLSKVSSGVKVNGRTTYGEVTGEWFKARLMLGQSPETDDNAGGRSRDVVTPSLIFGIKDLVGNPVAVTSEDLVEVHSSELGDATFRVAADPQPYRKKRRVIAYEVQLRRVESHEVS